MIARWANRLVLLGWVALMGTGCGTVPGPAATKPLHAFPASGGSIGPTPTTWATDHLTVTNAGTFLGGGASATPPHYLVRFPYKLSSDAPVVNGLAYLTSGDVSGSSHPFRGTIWAVNPNNGHIVWTRTLPNTAFAEPIVSDGRVYVGVGNIVFPKAPGSAHLTRGTGVSGLFVFSAAHGRPLWHLITRGADQAPVTVSNGIAYLASGDRELYAVQASNGHVLWKMPLHAYVSRSGPRIMGSTLFVGGASPGSVQAINLKTHQVEWRTLIPNAQAGVDDTPVALARGLLLTAAVTTSHDRVLSPASPRHHANLYALSQSTGKILWKVRLARGTMPGLKATGTPLIVGSRAYVGNAINGTVTALSVSTGRVLWRFQADSPVKKPPVYAKAHLPHLTVGNRPNYSE